MRVRTVGRSTLAVLVVATGFFATVGEGSTSSSGNKAPNAKSGDSSSAAAAEGSDKAKPIPVGTDVKVSSGWNLKVNSTQLDANQVLANGNSLQTPDAGKQYLIVNVSITNKSGKPDAALTNLKTSLLPASGVAIDPEFVAIGVPDVIDQMTELQPDAVYTGNIVFQVKTEEAAASLLLVKPQFTVDETGSQRFFSLQ